MNGTRTRGCRAAKRPPKGFARERSLPRMLTLRRLMDRVGEHPSRPACSRCAGSATGCRSSAPAPRRRRGGAAERRHGDVAQRRELGVKLSYHWLDDRGNAIVWDGPRVDFGGPVRRATRSRSSCGCARRCRPAATGSRSTSSRSSASGSPRSAPTRSSSTPRCCRASTSGGSPSSSAAARSRDDGGARRAGGAARRDRRRRDGVPRHGAVPAPDWSRRILDAHAEGFVAVGGSIEARDRSLRPGRPAAAATRPSRTRCCSRRSCRPRAGRARGPARLRPRRRARDLRRTDQTSTATRSSTRLKTSAPSASETSAATRRRPHPRRRAATPKKSGSRTASTPASWLP